MSGKGSAPRPFTDRERFEDNWAAMDWSAREKNSATRARMPESITPYEGRPDLGLSQTGAIFFEDAKDG